MTLLVVRRATQTNFPYRLVEREDLTPGRDDIIMLDERERPIDPSSNPSFIGTRIRLDEDPVREAERGIYVYYHCVRPAWEGQCFVPVEIVTGERGSDGAHYWIPITPVEVNKRVDDKLRCACGAYADDKTNYLGNAACSVWPDCVLD